MDGTATAGQAFGGDFTSDWQPKTEPVGEKKKFDAEEFIREYRAQTNTIGSKVQRISDAVRTAATNLLNQFWEMAKTAAYIATSKFMIEVCAMIIAAVSAALTKRHSRPVDITTPGVFYSNGTAPAASSNQSPQQGLWSSNSPFDNGWSQPSRAGAW